MMKKLLVASLLAALAAGCSSTNTVAQAEDEVCVPAPAGGNKPGKIAVNTICPIVPADAVDETVLVQHKGKTIALCCKGCIRKFDAMDEAGKDKVLATAMTYAK